MDFVTMRIGVPVPVNGAVNAFAKVVVSVGVVDVFALTVELVVVDAAKGIGVAVRFCVVVDG